MNIFIDRQQELKALERAHAADGGRLVVVYGRRRLGKTALIKEFIRGKAAAYYMCDRAGEKAQMEAFAVAMAEALCEPTLAAATYASWYDLFAAFDRLRQHSRRQVLIIDEYQYLCQTQPAFSSFLQKWWDEHWQNQNLTVILCGSVTSMMHRETLAASAPLYGRATAALLLRPLPFRHLQAFFGTPRSAEELLGFYALCGGVPRYIRLACGYPDPTSALKELVLSPDGILYSEARNLLRDEIPVPNVCWSILSAIATGATRISELGARLSLPANQLTRYLDLLKDLQLVGREVPVMEANPLKSKKGVYAVRDPFFRLWFGAIYPYESLLEMGQLDLVLDRISGRLASHVAGCYEEVCRELLGSDADAPKCLRVGRQWGAHYEIDIAGTNEAGELVVAGACKWSGQKVGLSVLNELRKKLADNALSCAAECRYVLFSKSGFSDELMALAASDPGVRLYAVLKRVRKAEIGKAEG